MEFFNFFTNLTNQAILQLFIKVFAVFFAFMYLIYAIIVVKQTSVMTKTVEGRGSGFIRFISLMQIVFALILIMVSIFVI